MKNLLIAIGLHLIFLFLTTLHMTAQSASVSAKVISSGTSSFQTGNICANSTLGEALISSKKVGNQYIGIGFQTTHLPAITTSVQDQRETLSLSVFPNPFSNDIFIKGDFLPEKVELYNLNGQLLDIVTQPGERISRWAQLPAGAYLLNGQYKGKTFYIGTLIKINS